MGNQLGFCCAEGQLDNRRVSTSDLCTVRTSSSEGFARPRPERLRPLMNSLEEAFKETCDEHNELTPDQLILMWVKCVEDNMGEISIDDRELIQSCVDHYSTSMDLDDNGMISYTEFMTYMLGGLNTRGAFGNLRSKLLTAMNKDPDILQKIFQKFKATDKDGNGFIEPHEIIELFNSMAVEFKADVGDPKSVAEDYMNQMDLDGDGKVDFYEFLSYQLGRRKRPVELLLYDLSNGFSKNFSLLLMGRSFEAIYHTGVICCGMEYWYGGSVFQNDPPMSKYFGEPLMESNLGLQDSEYKALAARGLKVVRVGYTLYNKQEILRYLNQVLAKKYTQSTYDVLNHNCNTFSDEFIYYLTGKHIPKEIKDLPQIAMQTRTAKLLRPVLNTYLGGFGNNEDSGELKQGADAEEPLLQELLVDAGLDEIPPFEIVPKKLDSRYHNEDVVLAKVTKLYPCPENAHIVEAVDLRFFDPTAGKMVTSTKVTKKRLEEALEYFAKPNPLAKLPMPNAKPNTCSVTLSEISKKSTRSSKGASGTASPPSGGNIGDAMNASMEHGIPRSTSKSTYQSASSQQMQETPTEETRGPSHRSTFPPQTDASTAAANSGSKCQV
eukprot:GEMP01008402.1.p1 GENE.GEMP01008402.1~~GEMP01008402.1.p1  ORF type:complete len:608 (+),score=102.51 GEMP01008402.1:98-1921(+)